jgi:hypothetical protein
MHNFRLGTITTSSTFNDADIYVFDNKINLICNGLNITTDIYYRIYALYSNVQYKGEQINCKFISLDSPTRENMFKQSIIVDEKNNICYANGTVGLINYKEDNI